MGCCCSSTDEADADADARVKWAEEQPCQSLRHYSSTTRLTTREKAPTRPDINLIAEAAEKRAALSKPRGTNLTPMQKIIRAQAKKELEEEQQRRLAQEMDQMKAKKNRQQQQLPKKREDKVLYTCELFDDHIALPKSEMMGAIEECLFKQLKDSEADQLTTSINIIYTLNKEEARKGAIEIIQKYLQNIVNQPKEPTFKQIKLSNQVFQEKVASCKGTVEFLKAVGFRQEQIGNEEYLVIHDDTAGNINDCEKIIKLLMDGAPAKFRVHRDPKVFRIDPTRKMPPQPEIPYEFYMVTVDDIRKEQQRRTESLEKTLTLRTQKTRDLEEARKKLPDYKYTYIRIRFPDNYIFQGIFNVFEKLSAVREFTRKHLAIDNGIFSLTTNSAFTNGNDGISDERTLTSLGLVPAAILYFSWDCDTMTKFQQKEYVQAIPYLSEEMQKSAENLY